MSISRWHRNTYLLALSLSLDAAFGNGEESTSNNANRLRAGARRSTLAIAEPLPRETRRRVGKIPDDSPNTSGGFHKTHAQSGSPAA